MEKIDIFEDKGFKALPVTKQSEILTNYFNTEIADDGYKELPQKTQKEIYNNFVSVHIAPQQTTKTTQTQQKPKPVEEQKNIINIDLNANVPLVTKPTKANVQSDDTKTSKQTISLGKYGGIKEVPSNPTKKKANPKTEQTNQSQSNIAPPAPVPSGIVEEPSFLDKAIDFIDDGAEEIGTFFKIGLDGVETAVNQLNPIAPITGELDIVEDSEGKKLSPKVGLTKFFDGKRDDESVEQNLMKDIVSIARTDIRTIGEATPEQKEQYLDNVANVLHRGGYSLGQDAEGNLVAVDDDGKPLKITNGFFEGIVDSIVSDKFEIGGATAGLLKGVEKAKSVPTPWAKAAVILGYSAGGAMGGTAIDTANTSLKTGQKVNVEDFINELSKSAALDAAGNVIGYGLVKGASAIAKVPVKESVTKAKDYIVNGNINGARDILKKELGVDEKYIESSLEQMQKDIKESTEYANSGITGKAKQQEELLAATSSDKRFGTNIIHDVILDNKDVAVNVAKTIDARTKNLVKTFGDVAIDGTQIKNSVGDYESAIQNQYSTMRNGFKEMFDNVDYKFNLNDLKVPELMGKVQSEIVDPYQKDLAKNLVEKVKTIVNGTKTESGITRSFDNLIELRQAVNEFYSRNQKAFKHDSKEIFRDLKKNIDDEIYSAVDKLDATKVPMERKKQLKDMFDDAIKEYRDMFEIQDTGLYKALMGDDRDSLKRMNGLIEHIKDDDGQFSKLMAKLPQKNKELIENSIVKSFVDKNIVGEANELQVVEYSKIANNIKGLKDFFVTDSGKESLSILEDMAKKYGDDLDLMKAAVQAGVDNSAGIATTIVGKIQYRMAKNAFDRLMRLVPFGNDGKRLALQHHIKEALEKSRTPVDMAKRVVSSQDLDKKTKSDLYDFIKDFNEFKKIENSKIAQETKIKEAQKLEQKMLEKEAKAEALKKEIENFTIHDVDEIRAVSALNPNKDKFQSFEQSTVRIQAGRGTPAEIENYIKIKNSVDKDTFEKIKLEVKYPLSEDNLERIKNLHSEDKELVESITGGENWFKALMYDGAKRKFRNDDLKDKYIQLQKIADEKIALQKQQAKEMEIEPPKAIDDVYDDVADDVIEGGYKTAEDGSLIAPDGKSYLFANGETLGGAFFGGSDAGFNQRDWNNDGEVNEEDILIGAIGGAVGFKTLSKVFPNWFKNEDGINSNKFNKESKNIAKVAMGEKPSTVIRTYDVDSLDDFVKFEKGGYNQDTNKGIAFDKIAIVHMQDNSNGYIKLDELINIGKILRDEKTEFFLQPDGRRRYTLWDDNVRYRVIIGDENNNRVLNFFTNRKDGLGHNAKDYTFSTTSSNGIIITFKPQKTFKEWLNSLEKNEDGVVIGAFGGKSPAVEKDFIDNQGFYSVLEKTIDEKVGGKIDTASLKKMLENNGVKDDELEWSGLKELMENGEKLTKEQIEDVIKSNRLEIEVVEKGSLENHAKIHKDYADGLIDYDESTKRNKANNPKYEKYVLDGGENYRELLFKLPDTKDGYKNQHWDEKNIIAFTRVDDRNIDNKKALFAEEIQSDLHQDGRKKGYITKDIQEKYDNLKNESLSIWKKYGFDRIYHTDRENTKLYKAGLTEQEDKLLDEYEVLRDSVMESIPNAPFKKNWHEFTLKRLIQEAVANDYDKIAWTTGKQQADRYNLQNTADTVVFNKLNGTLQVSNKGEEVMFKRVASEEELGGILGKEIANRLLDAKNTTRENIHVLRGDELKFGGEGMKAFYDEIVPNSAKKLFKKYGVKPKMEELDDIEEMVWSVDITEQMKEDIKKYGQPLYTVAGAGIVANETIGDDNETN